jgi:predicted ester cyclase
MSIEKNKEIARIHFEEVHNKGRVELMNDYYALDIPAGEFNSKEEYGERLLWFRKVAPDMCFTILDMVAEGDKVYVYHKDSMTYSVVPDSAPPLPMPPLGKKVEFRTVEMLRFKDGKLVEVEFVAEWMNMLVDAGVYVLAKPEMAQHSK